MKKLAIILAIAIMPFATPKQPSEQPLTAIKGTPPDAVMEQAEKEQEPNAKQVEQITEATREPISIESEVATEESPAKQETPPKECTEEIERQKTAEPEETVECVDKGDQTLAEYKPQSSGQPNPFENAPPAEIVDHSVEDLIGEGEDRPGEGKHF